MPITRLLLVLCAYLGLIASAVADELALSAGYSSASLDYRSGGTLGRSLDRGFSIYHNSEEGIDYASFNVRADRDAIQNGNYLLSVGFDSFAYRQNFETNDAKDNLALGLAYYLGLGYRWHGFNYPQQFYSSLSYSSPGLATRSIARLYLYNAMWTLEFSPEWTLRAGFQRLDVFYDEIDTKPLGERLDNSSFLGLSYRF